MRSPSLSEASAERSTERDRALVAFTRSVLDAARQGWPDRLVTDANAAGDPAQLYTETHFALASTMLALEGAADGEPAWLDVAAARLRLWNAARGPMTFFNSMAVCLIAIALRRAGRAHGELQAVVAELLERTHPHEDVAYAQWCGNNAYLQQVAVDTVLLPVARGQSAAKAAVAHLVETFRRYRTPEGFFYDLPREGTDREHLSPPAYIMKMLFLAGVCHDVTGDDALAELFQTGMVRVQPLLSRAGHFSYFGRTDNSPFAAGLTIFTLRKALHLAASPTGDSRADALPSGAPRATAFDEACRAAERYYRSSPRTPSGLLRCNRFADGTSPAEYWQSQDGYAYDGQYSLSSCAYALLGSSWHPAPASALPSGIGVKARALPAATSADLGLAKLTTGRAEIIVRTGSQITGWDRRYLGPTLLRYEQDDVLLVGAPSLTTSIDRALQPQRAMSRWKRIVESLRDRFARGFEQLDGTSVGFVPVLREGVADYLPGQATEQQVSDAHVATTYPMVRLDARGVRPCWTEAVEMVHNNLRVFGPKRYSEPFISPCPGIQLRRRVSIEDGRCRIVDEITGDVAGKRLWFSTRGLPGASIAVHGLKKVDTLLGWGSDGRQTIDVYEGADPTRLRYECVITTERRDH